MGLRINQDINQNLWARGVQAIWHRKQIKDHLCRAHFTSPPPHQLPLNYASASVVLSPLRFAFCFSSTILSCVDKTWTVHAHAGLRTTLQPSKLGGEEADTSASGQPGRGWLCTSVLEETSHLKQRGFCYMCNKGRALHSKIRWGKTWVESVRTGVPFHEGKQCISRVLLHIDRANDKCLKKAEVTLSAWGH